MTSNLIYDQQHTCMGVNSYDWTRRLRQARLRLAGVDIISFVRPFENDLSRDGEGHGINRTTILALLAPLSHGFSHISLASQVVRIGCHSSSPSTCFAGVRSPRILASHGEGHGQLWRSFLVNLVNPSRRWLPARWPTPEMQGSRRKPETRISQGTYTWNSYVDSYMFGYN